MSNTPTTLLNYLVENIVDDINKVSITEETDSYGQTLLRLTVGQEDMGKVIGKGGKTIRAIRTLVKALSIKNNVHTSVVLTEEYSSAPTN